MTRLSEVRGVRPLLAAEVTSSFASSVQAVAVPWLVLRQGGGAGEVGLVTAVELFALLTAGLPLGVVAHRLGSRRWLLASNSGRAVLVGVVAVLGALEALPFGLLLGLVAIIGALWAPTAGSQQDLLARFVAAEPDLLSRATSLLQSANRLAITLGPAIAGLLVNALAPSGALGLTAATCATVVGVVRFAVPIPTTEPAATSRPGLTAGVRELRRDRLVRRWTLGAFFSEAAYQALFVAIPLLALHRFHSGPAVAGLLDTAFGAGAVSGSLLAAAAAKRAASKRLILTAKAAQALLFATLAVNLPLAVALTVLGALGVANGLTNGPSAAIQIARLAAPLRASALVASFTFTMGGGALGSATAGSVISTRGFTTMFVLATATLTISWLLYYAGARQADHSPKPLATRTKPTTAAKRDARQ